MPQSYVKRITVKLIIYLIAVLGALFLAGFIMAPVFYFIPDTVDIFLPEYLASEGNEFRVEGFKQNMKIKYISLPQKEPRKTSLTKITFVDHKERLISLYNKRWIDDAELLHNSVKSIKEKKGARANGGYQAGLKHKSSFSDDTYCITEPIGDFVYILISPDSLKEKPVDILKEMGIMQRRTDISPAMVWLAVHKTLLIISLILAYCLLWLVGIFIGGIWVAKVKADPGVTPCLPDRLREQILALNELETPFKIEEDPSGIVRIEWKYDDTWKGIFASVEDKIIHDIKLKLRPNTHTVTAIETKKSVRREKGIFSFQHSRSYFRGITFYEYSTSYEGGLALKNGKLAITGKSFTFNLQQIKNPLIELITTSGWNWSPRLFFL